MKTTPDLCTIAREAATAADEIAKRKDRAAQRAYVERLVGATLIDQCHYNETTNEWTICGEQFRCLTVEATANWVCSGMPTKRPCLAYWSYTSYQGIYSLADLGRHLKQRDWEKERAKETAQRKTEEASKPSWLARLFS